MVKKSSIKVATVSKGPVKPMHSVGQPPILGWDDYSMFHYLKEIGVKYSRLHDTGGAFGKGIYVDIPNLFRDFDANPYDPASYDFAFTDKLLQAMIDNDIEPYFRLGVTIENSCNVKAYRIFPPKDNLQWARICEGVIRHYTQGWANGFNWNITHWEIWNEPENMPDPMENHMWRGTFEQYLALYETASKHLKSIFPNLMIGGYASCGMYAITRSIGYDLYPASKRRFDFLLKSFLDFVAFVKKNKCPLDFFSFHFYDVAKNARKQIEFIRKTLDDAGLTKTEMSLNEWMVSIGGQIGNMKQAAYIAAMIVEMQQLPVDDAELYDARCGMGSYSPLFDPITHEPRRAYHCLKAFNELYQLGNDLKVTGLPEGMYAAAAQKGAKHALMLVNISEKEQPLDIDFGVKPKAVKCYCIDETHNLDEIPMPETIADDTVLLIKY